MHRAARALVITAQNFDGVAFLIFLSSPKLLWQWQSLLLKPAPLALAEFLTPLACTRIGAEHFGRKG